MAKLNIGFFGHSACANDGPGTFIDQVINHFDAILVNKGAGQASEERILYQLKKSKNLDVAVIFHSRPTSVFLPNCNRDIDPSAAIKHKAKLIWPDVPAATAGLLDAWHGIYGNLKEIFKTPEEFINCIETYKNHLSNPDVQRNRFQGAFVLVYNYCSARVPVSVHIIDSIYMPPWFPGFDDSVRSTEIEKIMRKNRDISSPCGLPIEYHTQVAEILIDIIAGQLQNKGYN